MEMINFVPGVKDKDSGTVTILIDRNDLELLFAHLAPRENERVKKIELDLFNIISYIGDNYKF